MKDNGKGSVKANSKVLLFILWAEALYWLFPLNPRFWTDPVPQWEAPLISRSSEWSHMHVSNLVYPLLLILAMAVSLQIQQNVSLHWFPLNTRSGRLAYCYICVYMYIYNTYKEYRLKWVFGFSFDQHSHRISMAVQSRIFAFITISFPGIPPCSVIFVR